jgi:type II secretory pathway predicted ATPase ExeA
VPHGSYRRQTTLHPAFQDCIRRLFLLPTRLSMTAIREHTEMQQVAARLSKDSGKPVKLPSYPGAGKTMGIRDLIKTAGKRSILAVVAPKNNEGEQALGDQFFTALGLQLRGHWRTRKPKLMGHLHQYGVECLTVDDAHDLSLEHLMFIKEVTDQGRLQYDHPLGLCLVAAGCGNTILLKETLDHPDPTWLQFRRRLDKLDPFSQIAGHASEEVREILATLETVYQPLFPHLNLPEGKRTGMW